jgi:predicted nuclease of restriction endonuclease-like RecB superfamily
MLTAELVNVRLYKGEIKPRYVDPEDDQVLGLAEQLVVAFTQAVGQRRGELDAELEDILGSGTSFMLHRGLAKLLRDRCVFETASPVPPEVLRRAVFEAAAVARREGASVKASGEAVDEASDEGERGFDRQAVLGLAATKLDLSVETVEAGLFADLQDQQMLVDAQLPKARALLDRYNVALAQGVLLRARQLEIRIAGLSARDYEALFRQIRFHQLMHRVARDGSGQTGEGWCIILDGPISALQSSGRYGLAMAKFLPTLLHFGGWTLEARLAWGKRRRRYLFHLSPTQGLRPHNKLGGRWLPDEVVALAPRIAALATGWTVRPGDVLIDLGGVGVLVPDLVFEHTESGRVAYLEIFGFWNKGAVAKRVRLLEKHGPPNVVVAVLGSLAAGAAEDLDSLPGKALLFKRTILPKKVLCAVEEVAL